MHIDEVVMHKQVLRMSWEEYLALPPWPKAEWVAGSVVVSPPVGWDHGEAVVNLLVRLRESLPELLVVSKVGLRMPHDRLRAPDIMVVEGRPDGIEVVDTPVLVGEVLSPSTRSEDLIRKAAEYAAFAIAQYWIVDPDAETLEVWRNVCGAWDPLVLLDRRTPVGDVEVAPHGTVHLDLDEILPPR